KAKTDEGPKAPHSPMPDYIDNIFQLLALTSVRDVYEKFESDYNNCIIRYGDLKKQLAEDMIRFIAPIREKAKDIRNNETYMKEVMEKGAAKAGENAKRTMELTREAIGIKYF